VNQCACSATSDDFTRRGCVADAIVGVVNAVQPRRQARFRNQPMLSWGSGACNGASQDAARGTDCRQVFSFGTATCISFAALRIAVICGATFRFLKETPAELSVGGSRCVVCLQCCLNARRPRHSDWRQLLVSGLSKTDTTQASVLRNTSGKYLSREGWKNLSPSTKENSRLNGP
jgi:hypothetical protein